MSLCVSISSIFSLAHTGLAKRIQLHPTLLDAVEKCRKRWPNECNMLDPEFWTQGSGAKIYPESLENKVSPCWRFQVPFEIIYRASKRTVVPESGNCNSKCPVSKYLAPCRCEEPWEDPGRNCVGSSVPGSWLAKILQIHWRHAPLTTRRTISSKRDCLSFRRSDILDFARVAFRSLNWRGNARNRCNE